MKKLLLLLSVFIPFIAAAEIFKGRAVKVADGDTFTLLTDDKQQIKVRLHGIDCPERGQAFGRVATEFAREFLSGKSIQVIQTDIDRYGRIVGIAIAGKDTLNTSLLKSGLAWHYKRYDKQQSWADMEQRARFDRLGLWKDKTQIAPWEWRKSTKKQ